MGDGQFVFLCKLIISCCRHDILLFETFNIFLQRLTYYYWKPTDLSKNETRRSHKLCRVGACMISSGASSKGCFFPSDGDSNSWQRLVIKNPSILLMIYASNTHGGRWKYFSKLYHPGQHNTSHPLIQLIAGIWGIVLWCVWGYA